MISMYCGTFRRCDITFVVVGFPVNFILNQVLVCGTNDTCNTFVTRYVTSINRIDNYDIASVLIRPVGLALNVTDNTTNVRRCRSTYLSRIVTRKSISCIINLRSGCMHIPCDTADTGPTSYGNVTTVFKFVYKIELSWFGFGLIFCQTVYGVRWKGASFRAFFPRYLRKGFFANRKIP